MINTQYGASQTSSASGVGSASSADKIHNHIPNSSNPLDPILAKIEMLLQQAEAATGADGAEAQELNKLITALNGLKAVLTLYNKTDGKNPPAGAQIAIAMQFALLNEAFQGLPASMQNMLNALSPGGKFVNSIFDNSGGNVPVSSGTILAILGQVLIPASAGPPPTAAVTFADVIQQESTQVSALNALLQKYGLPLLPTDIQDLNQKIDINWFNNLMAKVEGPGSNIPPDVQQDIEKLAYSLYVDAGQLQKQVPANDPGAYSAYGNSVQDFNAMVAELAKQGYFIPDLNKDLSGPLSPAQIADIQAKIKNLPQDMQAPIEAKLTAAENASAAMYPNPPGPTISCLGPLASAVAGISDGSCASLLTMVENCMTMCNTDIDQLTTDIQTQASLMNQYMQMMSALFAAYLNTGKTEASCI